MSIVIPNAKPYEPSIRVVQTPREPEWLKPGTCAGNDVSKLIVVHTLCNLACRDVDDQPWTTQMIGDDAVCGPSFDHEVGHVLPNGVNKTGNNVVRGIKFGGRSQPNV